MSGFHFDDIVKVVEVDADGKKYDKGSIFFKNSTLCHTILMIDSNGCLG